MTHRISALACFYVARVLKAYTALLEAALFTEITTRSTLPILPADNHAQMPISESLEANIAD